MLFSNLILTITLEINIFFKRLYFFNKHWLRWLLKIGFCKVSAVNSLVVFTPNHKQFHP